MLEALVAAREVGKVEHQPAFAQLELEPRLGPAPFGDVADEADERILAFAADEGDRQLDRKLAAVAAEPGQLEALVQHPGDALAVEPREPAVMGLAQRRRHD